MALPGAAVPSLLLLRSGLTRSTRSTRLTRTFLSAAVRLRAAERVAPRGAPARPLRYGMGTNGSMQSAGRRGGAAACKTANCYGHKTPRPATPGRAELDVGSAMAARTARQAEARAAREVPLL